MFLLRTGDARSHGHWPKRRRTLSFRIRQGDQIELITIKSFYCWIAMEYILITPEFIKPILKESIVLAVTTEEGRLFYVLTILPVKE